jgi:hypothetical protein
VLDNKTLIVEDDTHQKFKMTLMGYCPNLAFKERVGFKSIGGRAQLPEQGRLCARAGYRDSRSLPHHRSCPIRRQWKRPIRPPRPRRRSRICKLRREGVAMKIKLSAIALLACLVTLPALADRPTCLVIRQIYNWNVVDPQTLIVENIAHSNSR